MDKENATIDLAAVGPRPGQAHGRRSRSKSLGPGGLAALQETTGNSVKVKSILKAANALSPKQSVSPPKPSKKGRRETMPAREQSIQHDFAPSLPSPKAPARPSPSAQREARRKSMLSRRVSFAPEATLHTWNVVEIPEDSTTSTSPNSTRRSSALSSHPPPTSDPPSTPTSEGSDVQIAASPAHQRDLHQTKRRRSSQRSSYSDQSSSPYADEGDLQTIDAVDESSSGSESDHDLVEEETMDATLQSAGESTGSSARLEAALQQAARQAGTRGIEFDEHGDMTMEMANDEITNAFQPWAQPNASLAPADPFSPTTADQTMEMTKPVGGIILAPPPALQRRRQSIVASPVKARISDAAFANESTVGDETMDLTVPMGNIQGDLAMPLSNIQGDQTMDLTVPMGNILGPETSLTMTASNQSPDQTMDLTAAIGSIQVPSVEPGTVPSDANEDLTMEMTTVVGGVLHGFRAKQDATTRLKDDAAAIQEQDGNDAMDFTTAVGAILSPRRAVASPSPRSSPGKTTPRRMSPSKPETPRSAKTAPSPFHNGSPQRPMGAGLLDERPLPARRNAMATPEAPISSGSAAQTPVQERPQAKTPESARKSPWKLHHNPYQSPSATKTPPPSVGVRKSPAAKSYAPVQTSPAKSYTPTQTSSIKSQTPSGAPQTSPKKSNTPAQTSPAKSYTPAQTSPAKSYTPAQTSPAKSQTPAQTSPTKSQTPSGAPQTSPAKSYTPAQTSPAKGQTPLGAPQTSPANALLKRRSIGDSAAPFRAEGQVHFDTDNLKDRIEQMTPQKSRMRGRKSLHVGAARGLLGKRPVELDQEDPESPVKKVKLPAPPSQTDTTGSARMPLLEIHGNGELPQNEERIQLQDFLSMTGIRFMELTTAKRRQTIIPSNGQTPQAAKADSLEERVVAGACTVPMLELYQHVSSPSPVRKYANKSCRELKTYIAEGRRVAKEIEEAVFEDNPALFKQYLHGSTELKTALENQFKNGKTYARLQSKAMWYEWRMKLLDGLQAGLRDIEHGMDGDLRILKQQQQLLQPVLPALEEFSHQLEHTLEREQSRAEELASDDPLQLQAARDELQQLSSTLVVKQASVDQMQRRLETQENTLEALVEERERIGVPQESQSGRDWTHEELQRLRKKVAALEGETGWRIGSTATGVSMIYRDTLQLDFDPAGSLNLSLLTAMTTERRFFLQILRAQLHALPQERTRELLAFVSRSWDSAMAIVQQVEHLALEYMTASDITGDESMQIRATILLKTMRTKVQVALAVGVHARPECLRISVRPSASVVYGETLNEARMNDFLEGRIKGTKGGAGWAAVLADLEGRCRRR